jgi:hypothetical protein
MKGEIMSDEEVIKPGFPEDLMVFDNGEGELIIVDENQVKRYGPFPLDTKIDIWYNGHLNHWCIKVEGFINYEIVGEK